MSSENDRFRMRQLLQSGAATYIVKPFNVDQLIIMVEKLLSDHFQLMLKERERLATERQAMLASISSLVQALEARDQYTRGHSEAWETPSSSISVSIFRQPIIISRTRYFLLKKSPSSRMLCLSTVKRIRTES